MGSLEGKFHTIMPTNVTARNQQAKGNHTTTEHGSCDGLAGLICKFHTLHACEAAVN